MKNYIKYTILSFLLPIVSHAQLDETRGLLEAALDIVRSILIPLAFTAALLFFFWGIAKYIWSAGSQKDEGKQIMYWGVIALFVMSTIWGLIYFIADEIGLPARTSSDIPNIQLVPGGGSSAGSASLGP